MILSYVHERNIAQVCSSLLKPALRRESRGNHWGVTVELIELLDQIGMVTVTLQYWAECRVPVSDVASVNASGEFAIVLRKGSRSCSEKVLK